MGEYAMPKASCKMATGRLWLLWFTFFVAIDFVIPYTLLKDVPRFYGAYLFWVVITVVVIASAMVYLSSWREVKGS